MRTARALGEFGVEGLEEVADAGQRADVALDGDTLFMRSVAISCTTAAAASALCW